MEKKILSGIFALALLITAGYGVNKSVNSNADLSLLALSNVEALGQTSGEDVVLPVANMKGAVGQVFQPHQDFTGLQRDYCVWNPFGI